MAPTPTPTVSPHLIAKVCVQFPPKPLSCWSSTQVAVEGNCQRNDKESRRGVMRWSRKGGETWKTCKESKMGAVAVAVIKRWVLFCLKNKCEVFLRGFNKWYSLVYVFFCGFVFWFFCLLRNFVLELSSLPKLFSKLGQIKKPFPKTPRTFQLQKWFQPWHQRRGNGVLIRGLSGWRWNSWNVTTTMKILSIRCPWIKPGQIIPPEKLWWKNQCWTYPFFPLKNAHLHTPTLPWVG